MPVFLCLRRASSAGVYAALGKAAWKASAALMHLTGYFIHGRVFWSDYSDKTTAPRSLRLCLHHAPRSGAFF